LKPSIAIVGGGSAALMFAAKIDTTKYTVTIYEKNAAIARKFLVAGDGGFNLTHSEDIGTFIKRYTPSDFLEKSLRNFSNIDLQIFLKSIQINTYTGTSKRIFPIKGIKPIDVLNAFLKLIESKNVQIKTKHTWKGWNQKNELIFEHNENDIFIKPDYVIFSLGGSSWVKTGSDGIWTNYFQEKEIKIIPFTASNCTYQVEWKNDFIEHAAGNALKNIEVSCNHKSKRGELVITPLGLEGGAIYALSPQIREQLVNQQKENINIELKHTITEEEISHQISVKKGNKSITKHLTEVLNINKTVIELLKHQLTKEEFLNPKTLAQKIKQLPITITNFGSIDKAISTVGGISLSEINENFELKKLPNHFVIGEMLDWDAPTGGYLLQACFSMGAAVATIFNQH